MYPEHCRLRTRPGQQAISAPNAYPPSLLLASGVEPTWWAYFLHLTGSIPTVLHVSREEKEGGREDPDPSLAGILGWGLGMDDNMPT